MIKLITFESVKTVGNLSLFKGRNNVKPNTPIDMPNLLEKQIKEGRSVSIFPIHEYWLDIGHMKEYESAHDSFSNGFTLDD